MNREQIMALSDEELRIKAGELMGYTDISLERVKIKISGEAMIHPEDVPYGFYPGRHGKEVIPDYPHYIAMAWALVDSKTDHSLSVQIKPVFDDEGVRIGVIVEEVCATSAYTSAWPRAQIMEKRRGTEPKSALTARAITRTFILVMTQEEE